MKKNFRKICAVIFSAAFLFCMFSCASTSKSGGSKGKKGKFSEEGYREAVANCDWDTAMGMLSSLSELTIDQQIDLGLMQHYTGDYEAGCNTLEAASKAIDEAMPSDAKDFLKARLATSEYIGNLYEYLLVDTVNALNYYKKGDIENAYSCLKRVGDKQKNYMARFGDVITREVKEPEQPLIDNETKQTVISALSVAGVDAVTANNLFDDFSKLKLPPKAQRTDVYDSSALSDYLQIIISAQNGSNVDDYIVNELKKLSKGVDTSVVNLTEKSSEGRIEVLALTGSISQKQQDTMSVDVSGVLRAMLEMSLKNANASDKVDVATLVALLTSGDAKVGYNINYPKYVAKDDAPVATKITLSSGESKEAVLLEDFNKAVIQEVNLKARKTVNMNVPLDLTTKTPVFPVQLAAFSSACVTAEAIPVPAAKEKVLNKAKDICIDALNAVDPKADIRQSMAMPSKAYCAGFTVAPGTYTVTIEYSNGTSDTISDVVVKAGKPVLVESVCK